MHVFALFGIFGPLFLGFACSQCLEDDDAYIGGLCYTVSTYKESFPVAQNACHRKNQNLAIIKSSLQANYLATTVQKITNEQNGKFWIGLNRSSINSRYQWDDGTPLVWSNFDSKFSQNQLWVAESTQNGKWTTLDGGEAHFFVCSHDPTATTPRPSTTNGPWETTPYPNDGSTTYGPWETTPYPDDGSTTYGPWETTSYDDYATTDYPDYGTTDYPDYESTEYPDYDPTTTDFPEIRINKFPKPFRRFFQKKL